MNNSYQRIIQKIFINSWSFRFFMSEHMQLPTLALGFLRCRERFDHEPWVILKAFSILYVELNDMNRFHSTKQTRTQWINSKLLVAIWGRHILHNGPTAESASHHVSTPDRDFQFQPKSFSFDMFHGLESVRVF